MRVRDQARRGDSSSRALLWAERGLIATGAAMLAGVAIVAADARVAQYLAREALAAVPRAPASVSASARPLFVSRGAPIGELSIPRLGLVTMVLHGSDEGTLRRGPGHVEHTALPGEPGNVAIAGHRDSFFRPLRRVRTGDDIYLDTAEGRFHYRVSSLEVVGPDAVSVLAPTPTATLTLITCHPFWMIGPAPDRFIVRATEVARPASPR
jgi:LPXTG-site transpeptidase (sortase) family protein